MPIFWPLSVLWAPVQFPAWLLAQDGHGRQRLCGGKGSARGGWLLCCRDTSLLSLSEPSGCRLTVLLFHPAPPPPTTQDSALCLPFSSPHEAKSPPFPTSCPPKREGISRCFNHSLSFNPLGHPVEVPFSAPFQTKRRQDSEKHNHLPNRRRAKVKFKPRLAQLQIPASFLSLPPSLKAVGCQKWD